MTIEIDLEQRVDSWEILLSSANYRVTEPRREILRAIARQDRLVGAEELARQLKPRGTGRATVFRTVDMLTDLGIPHRMHVNCCHAYSVCPPVHHHHLTCLSCGKVERVQGCGLETQLARVAQETGFAIEDHQLELTGRCASCRQAMPLLFRYL